jgi:hypothetical protein
MGLAAPSSGASVGLPLRADEEILAERPDRGRVLAG